MLSQRGIQPNIQIITVFVSVISSEIRNESGPGGTIGRLVFEADFEIEELLNAAFALINTDVSFDAVDFGDGKAGIVIAVKGYTQK